MKRIFQLPTAEFSHFETEEAVTISGLMIFNDSGSTEHAAYFSVIQSIFADL